ncbi:MAG: hypothetical protein B6D70_10140 [gamma proteobacterium symbiont of Stewartia floridana]|nr:DUF1488 domain-containing protein [Candidatus Thiodiazotropha taylori]RLW57819.1 MAG: hypothetical protein B6D75_16135 [gamma proteobacterium symbiont of Stewartia floridana]RLW60859.1 MAG: hypothetical protein B6D70_10140 [gamma proteobacterium symbiont of Stewartia floridana]RLW63401.1 MAG: hypothetical protein B6D73_15635 [gamma proteobacterium symbiont of Stewartia floridana]RLW69976.1 MAG: hypothetical protein B6D71_08235 [gamma proteobacterium symbiont of Stewartia floridana]
MQFSNYRRTISSGDSGISFPQLESWNSVTKVATVAAQYNKQRVLCRISQKTLQNTFGALEDDPMKSVAKHRLSIQQAAKSLIESEIYEEDGSVLILECHLV